MEGKIRVGCIADDFTGASDAASFLRRQGMKTVLFNGLPEEKLPENCDAIVVALKSRTAPVKEAVNDSIQALKWMKAQEDLWKVSCSCSGSIGFPMNR